MFCRSWFRKCFSIINQNSGFCGCLVFSSLLSYHFFWNLRHFSYTSIIYQRPVTLGLFRSVLTITITVLTCNWLVFHLQKKRRDLELMYCTKPRVFILYSLGETRQIFCMRSVAHCPSRVDFIGIWLAFY